MEHLLEELVEEGVVHIVVLEVVLLTVVEQVDQVQEIQEQQELQTLGAVVVADQLILQQADQAVAEL
jgi:hypothetical protein